MGLADPYQIDQIVRVTLAGQINDDVRDVFADIRGNVANEFVAAATESGEWPALRALLPEAPRRWYPRLRYTRAAIGRLPIARRRIKEALDQALAGIHEGTAKRYMRFVARRIGL